MAYAACFIAGMVLGFALTIWGFLSIPRNAARMFNTPPKEK
jgi:hypothetical protein